MSLLTLSGWMLACDSSENKTADAAAGETRQDSPQTTSPASGAPPVVKSAGSEEEQATCLEFMEQLADDWSELHYKFDGKIYGLDGTPIDQKKIEKAKISYLVERWCRLVTIEYQSSNRSLTVECSSKAISDEVNVKFSYAFSGYENEQCILTSDFRTQEKPLLSNITTVWLKPKETVDASAEIIGSVRNQGADFYLQGEFKLIP